MLELYDVRRSWVSGRLIGNDEQGRIWLRGGEGRCLDCRQQFHHGWKDAGQNLGYCNSCTRVAGVRPGEEDRLTVFPGGRVP